MDFYMITSTFRCNGQLYQVGQVLNGDFIRGNILNIYYDYLSPTDLIDGEEMLYEPENDET